MFPLKAPHSGIMCCVRIRVGLVTMFVPLGGVVFVFICGLGLCQALRKYDFERCPEQVALEQLKAANGGKKES